MNLPFRQLLAGIFLLAACDTMANALQINATFDSSFNSDSNAAADEATIETAISTIDGDLANPVVVDVTFSDTGTTGLGESNGDFYAPTYSTYYSGLSNQNRSSYDNTAIASLGANTNGQNPVNGTTGMLVPGALMEALGIGGVTGPVNATVGLALDITNANTGHQDPDKYNLQAVTAHELDEILGIGGAGSNLQTTGDNSTVAIGEMDLYRYAANGVRSFTNNTSTAAYFSINGGATNLVNFNRVAGADYGDWGDGTPSDQNGNTPPQVQDAYSTSGVTYGLGSNELTALDVVGWNLTAQGMATEAAPEPSTWALVGLGLGALMFLGRRPLIQA